MYDPSLGSNDSHKYKERNGSRRVPHPPGRQAQLFWGFLLTAPWCTGLPWYLYARRIRKSQARTENAVPAYIILNMLVLKEGTRLKLQQEVEDQECNRKWVQRLRWARKPGKRKGCGTFYSEVFLKIETCWWPQLVSGGIRVGAGLEVSMEKHDHLGSFWFLQALLRTCEACTSWESRIPA